MQNIIEKAAKTTIKVAEDLGLKKSDNNGSFIHNWLVFVGDYKDLNILLIYERKDEYLEFTASRRVGTNKIAVRSKISCDLINDKGVDFCVEIIEEKIKDHIAQ